MKLILNLHKVVCFNLAWALDSTNTKRLRAKAWCEERDFRIQMLIADRSLDNSLLDLRRSLQERGYELLEDVYDKNVSVSEVQYYEEEDRPVAGDVLEELQNQFPERDFNLVKNPPLVGPGDVSK